MRQETYLFDRQRRNIKFKTSHPERKIAFFLFMLTVLAAFFFWIKTDFDHLWRQLTKPATFEIISPLKSLNLKPKEEKKLKSEEEVVREIEALTNDLRGKYAVYIYSFNSGKEYGINQKEVFPAASVNKVPVILAFYRELEKNKFSPTEEYKLQEQDIQGYGTGVMLSEEPGKIFTYEELLQLSGKKSDNTAAYVLSKILGFKNLEIFLQSLGLKNTSIEKNETTAFEAGKLFVLTYEGNILKTGKYKQQFFDNLTETDFEDRIPAGIPKDIGVAHKIGSLERVYHDCGIVFGENPFVLCILSQETAENEALDVIPKIARLVWEFEEKKE